MSRLRDRVEPGEHGGQRDKHEPNPVAPLAVVNRRSEDTTLGYDPRANERFFGRAGDMP